MSRRGRYVIVGQHLDLDQAFMAAFLLLECDVFKSFYVVE